MFSCAAEMTHARHPMGTPSPAVFPLQHTPAPCITSPHVLHMVGQLLAGMHLLRYDALTFTLAQGFAGPSLCGWSYMWIKA